MTTEKADKAIPRFVPNPDGEVGNSVPRVQIASQEEFT